MTWEKNPSEEPRENLKQVPPTDDEVRQVDLGTFSGAFRKKETSRILYVVS